MPHDYDLVIRRGTVADGTGSELKQGDVAVRDGRIVGVGDISGRGVEEIDASGLLVTPGFVDIHTHYDGQVMWDDHTEPSTEHGVTTVVTGNCGVGFAPCRESDRLNLISLMEGVEDIPEIVMSQGLPWTWESFPEFLDAADRPRDIDVAMQLPHSALRVYVMGQRAIDREPANDRDIAQMALIAKEAMEAGAVGFATSRSIFHRDNSGRPIPTIRAEAEELRGIVSGLKAAGRGVIEALVDFDRFEEEFALLRNLCAFSGRPLSFTLAQTIDHPHAWRRGLELLGEVNAAGLEMRGQVIGRPTGMMLGLNLSYNPFTFYLAYAAIAHLPLAERVTRMRQPETRHQILGNPPASAPEGAQKFLERFDWMFPLGNPPQYEPPLESSFAATAARMGRSPQEVAYDVLLQDEGEAVIFLPVANYAEGSLDSALEMMRDPHTLLGLGDGGAHYGMICDAGYPTFMLTYWARERKGERIDLQEVVKALSFDPAEFIGLHDRGRIAPGAKADINIIDLDRLALHAPRIAFDLPAGGRRLKQHADGFAATLVNGTAIRRDGSFTGALPGRLVRGEGKPNPVRAGSR